LELLSGWFSKPDGDFRRRLIRHSHRATIRQRQGQRGKGIAIMKFILISRHTNGAEIPEIERAQNLQEMGEWIALIKPTLAVPIRGGKTVTANSVERYRGDIGGAIVFEADNLDEAVALAKKSPGLKYGFTHEVLPEISLSDAASRKVSDSA
jgi:hypothetical protein